MALEKAHEWLPGNKDISENLDDLKRKMENLISSANRHNLNFPNNTLDEHVSKNSHSYLRLVIFIIIVIGGYLIVKNYLIEDRTTDNLITKETIEPTSKVSYSVSNLSTQKGTACVSVLTPAVLD